MNEQTESWCLIYKKMTIIVHIHFITDHVSVLQKWLEVVHKAIFPQ